MNGSVPNQCKTEGWPNYKYHVKIIAANRLDKDDFVIDHQEVHTVVAACFETAASCERLCLNIEESLHKALREHGVVVKSLYIMVQPVLQSKEDNYAHMELDAKYT